MRRFFLYFIPLVMPILVYFIWDYWYVIKNNKKHRKEPPWAVLIIIGTIFAIIFLGFFTTNEKAPTRAKYEPPKYENGELIPGKMKY